MRCGCTIPLYHFKPPQPLSLKDSGSDISKVSEGSRLKGLDIGIGHLCVCVMSGKWSGSVGVFREMVRFLTNQSIRQVRRKMSKVLVIQIALGLSCGLKFLGQEMLNVSLSL